MKNIAVVLAGGSGSRMGEDYPKQLLKIAGKKVIEHTLDVFEKHPLIHEIFVVSHTNYIHDIEDIVTSNNYHKLTKILSGGKERYESSWAAIQACEEKECNIILHDSVRPLINERIITDCIEALKTYNAVDVAIPTTDTIIQVSEDNKIKNIPQRSTLRNGQTPQAFKLSVIKEAYQKAMQDPQLQTTDDCGIILKYLPDEPIYVVNGEVFNLKLTYKSDLFLLDKLFQLKSIHNLQHRINNEEKKQLAGKVIVLFGGSYGIGKSIADICSEAGARVFSFSRSSNKIDVSNHENVAKALKQVHEETNRIDYIVNTAGILMKQPLEGMSYENIWQIVNVNVLGAINVAKEAFKYLKQSQGMLLLYTSSSYTRGRSLYRIYSASKSAVVNLMQALSEEWYKHHISVNCINPERTKTPMRIRNFGNEPEETLLTAEDVANVSINTLLSNMTGEVIDVKLSK